jgi:hypothetical protein
MSTPFQHACPQCGHVSIDWDSAPGLRDTLDFIKASPVRGRTSADVADRFNISLSNACNRTAKLHSMGLVRYEASVNPKGGVLRTFWAVEA